MTKLFGALAAFILAIAGLVGLASPASASGCYTYNGGPRSESSGAYSDGSSWCTGMDCYPSDSCHSIPC
jgi:hypothetical protein